MVDTLMCLERQACYEDVCKDPRVSVEFGSSGCHLN